jgi:hypothetical protein
MEAELSLLAALDRCVEAQQALLGLIGALGVPDSETARLVAALDQAGAEIRELRRTQPHLIA